MTVVFNLNKMINAAITRAVQFLLTSQEKDGSYLVYSSPCHETFDNCKEYHSIFPSTLILDCLNSIDNLTGLDKVKDKLASFILPQQSYSGSFNYWARDSIESKTISYPDDLDSTFCTLSALTKYSNKLINGSIITNVINILTLAEIKEGGPYRTWLVSGESIRIWQDVDLAVNSNVAYFLSLHGIKLPNLTLYVEQAISKKDYYSLYYPSSYSVIFLFQDFIEVTKLKRLKTF